MILQYIFTFLMLTLLQAVLGFDNLLYISIESKRVPEERQSFVRKWGIGIAIVLRIVLLVVVVKAIEHFQEPFATLHSHPIYFDINVHALIVLLGGAFIIYTAVKEISHMLSDHSLTDGAEDEKRSVGSALFWIILMNLVFSFDSILSAIALASEEKAPAVATLEPGEATANAEEALANTEPEVAQPATEPAEATPAESGGTERRAREITTGGLIVMSLSVICSGIMMIWLSDRVSDFLQKNRLYEVLGLFILFIVGIMLVSEGGHLAHVKLFGHEVHPMAKSTFYFVLAVLIVVDIVQGRYQKKLMAQAAARAKRAASVKS